MRSLENFMLMKERHLEGKVGLRFLRVPRPAVRWKHLTAPQKYQMIFCVRERYRDACHASLRFFVGAIRQKADSPFFYQSFVISHPSFIVDFLLDLDCSLRLF